MDDEMENDDIPMVTKMTNETTETEIREATGQDVGNVRVFYEHIQINIIKMNPNSYPIIEITAQEDIVFRTPFGEMLRLCENGDFIVKGKITTNDMEIYKSMKEFLFNMR